MQLKQEDITGLWRLMNYTVEKPNGKRCPLWPEIKGHLLFTLEGQISAVIVRLPLEDNRACDIISYIGRYHVVGHRIHIDVLTSNVARHFIESQRRKIHLKGEQLVMVLLGHPTGTHEVTWIREL